MDNGGGTTLISYGQDYGDIVNVNVVPEQHLRWIKDLPLMHVDRHRVYVHAGVDPDLPLASQDPEQLLWEITKAPISAVTARDMSCTGITKTGMVQSR